MRQREYRAPYFLIGSGDPTSVSELSKIFTTAPNYGRDQDLSEESTEVLCEVLVNYIRNLPEPIFDTNLWEFLWGFCIESGFEDSGPIKRKSVTKKVFEIMPTRNLSLITCLIEFLNKLVLVPENFLSPEAISEVLGPTFLCVKKSVDFAFKSNLTAQALITIFQARKALCWMIRFWQEVVTVDEKLEFSDGIETPVIHNAESKLYSEGSGFPKQDEAILEAEGFYNYKKLPEELIVDSKQHKDLDSRDKDVEWVSLIPHTPSFISTSFLPTRSKPISPVSAISESVCLSIHHSSCKRFSDLTSVSNIIDLGRYDLELSMKRLSKLRCSISESDRGFSNSKLTESFKYSAQIDTRVPVKSAKKSDELESPLKLSSALPQPEYSSSLGMDESSVSPISPRSDYKEHRTLNCLKSRSTGNFGISKKQSPNNKTTKSSHKDKFSSHENFQDEISSSTKIRSFPRNSSNLSLRISPNNINRLKPNTSNPRCAAPTGILPPTASTRDRWSSIPYDCSMNEKTKAALEKARALQLRSALRATKSKISVTAPLLDGKEKINAALAQVLTCQNELLNLSEILRSLESNYSK
ncbi:expressed protein [Phakopsora pachyrhizi]|uniref:Expressed protein n=1 Tax=Phakopsora pachyrhizi TaxID=170000 RepID=A0AAV0ASS0_PHAPC|nr:expressed protein [Phakopsora pachyrhizi]